MNLVKLKNKSNEDYRFGEHFIPAKGESKPMEADIASKLVVLGNGRLERIVEEAPEIPKEPEPEIVEEKVEEPVEEPKEEPEEGPEDEPEPEEKAYKCETCKKSFDTERGLATHKRLAHK
jgi:outer membrane biosynthesis protein TonB